MPSAHTEWRVKYGSQLKAQFLGRLALRHPRDAIDRFCSMDPVDNNPARGCPPCPPSSHLCQQCGKLQTEHNRQPYHAYVHSLCGRWRRLQHLDNFMNEPFHRALPRGRPSPSVAIIDVSTLGITLEGEFTEAASLLKYLDSSSSGARSRYFVIEDLSVDIIELRGTRFDVEPEFFSAHIYSLDWFSRCSSPTTVPCS